MARFWSHFFLLALAVILTAPARSVAPDLYGVLALGTALDAGDERQQAHHIDCAVLDWETDEERAEKDPPRKDLAVLHGSFELFVGDVIGQTLVDAELPSVSLAWRSHVDKARGPPLA